MSDWYTESRQNKQLEELRDEMSTAMTNGVAHRIVSRLSFWLAD
jgi:hypothetical protein